MNKILSILIIGLFFQNIYAQKKPIKLQLIYEVNNPENFHFKKDEFLLKDSTEIYKKLQQIKSLLIKKSYLSASIDSIVKDSSRYYAYLFIGNSYHWQLNTAGIPRHELKSANITKKSYNGQKIKINTYLKNRQKLLQYYDNQGYPFAETYIDSILISNNYISGKLKINKQTKFYIDTVYIKGKIKLSPKFIYHNIGIKPGDVFSGESLSQIDANIQRLNFVSMIKPAELEFFPAKADLYLYLKKQKSNFFSGVLGFANSENSNRLKLTGNIALDLDNSFTIGENISLRWESYADSSQYLFTYLKLPYLFFLPIGISANFELDKTTMDYLNMNYSFSLSYDFSSGNGVNLYYRHKQSFLINQDTSETIANTNNTTFGMQMHTDNTQASPIPLSGYKISISTGYGNRSTGKIQESIFEANLYAAYYWQINQYFNLFLRNVSAGVFNKTGFYENEMFKLGGIKTVRGFDEKSLLASTYTIFTFEPRFFIDEYSFLSVFADYVYFNTFGIETQTINSAIGLGVGFNINTKAGIFNLNFAIGSLNRQAFQISNTKIHVGYTARF
ncbi:MAG: hypothetical protein L3J74_06735 [Bacteroidales bacterium]|nr:hypothetical protein [Bacteroidales bacterium]